MMGKNIIKYMSQEENSVFKREKGVAILECACYVWLGICFNWSVIALQFCVTFCCTTKWISYMYTYIPSLMYFPPTLPHFHLSRSSLSWAPCIIEQLPASYLFESRSCIYVNLTLPIHLTLPFLKMILNIWECCQIMESIEKSNIWL